MKRLLSLAFAIALCLTLVLTAAATGARQEVRVGNIFLADDGGISPSSLPKHRMAPVTASIFGEIGTLDGSHPPAVKTVAIDVDETIALDAVGLPACRQSQLEATNTATAKRVCGAAIVGSGKAEVQVSFPDQTPFSARGPVLAFNGGVKGKTTTVLLHAYVAVPAPTAVVVRASVTRINEGRYGMRIEAEVPKIAGGAGSITRFQLEVGRDYAYKGKRKSLLTARCPTGRWATKGNVSFADGTRLGLTHLFPCTPRS